MAADIVPVLIELNNGRSITYVNALDVLRVELDYQEGATTVYLRDGSRFTG